MLLDIHDIFTIPEVNNLTLASPPDHCGMGEYKTLSSPLYRHM